MILCACSPYFKNLLEQNPAKHPIIILKDVPFAHLTAILEFMYAGEVNVAQEQRNTGSRYTLHATKTPMSNSVL